MRKRVKICNTQEVLVMNKQSMIAQIASAELRTLKNHTPAAILVSKLLKLAGNLKHRKNGALC